METKLHLEMRWAKTSNYISHCGLITNLFKKTNEQSLSQLMNLRESHRMAAPLQPERFPCDERVQTPLEGF